MLRPGWIGVPGAFLLILCATTSAHAEGSCTLGGQKYPENAVVCSGGLVLACSNGTWQNNNGARCDAPSGAYLTPQRPYQERNAEPIPDFYLQQYPWLAR